MAAKTFPRGQQLCRYSMTHLFINSLAASAGGGVTYIRNVIPRLAAKPGVQATVALPPRLRQEFRSISNVNFIELEIPAGRRFWFEQSQLPAVILRSGADVLLSAGNFALRRSPVPQILLSRNSIYTSADFYRDLLKRQDYGAWLDTHFRAILARRSIHWADVTVAPSEAFASELRRWTGKPVCAVHHGFDYDVFTSDESPLTPEVEDKLRETDDALRLLFVSHYNYYRNFETLIRALPMLRDRMARKPVRLLLTCKLITGANPGAYKAHRAAKLIRELGVEDMVIELGTIPYSQLHLVYRRADIYVTPAYTETFAHPLVEAMASGLPIVASDLAVHHEICGECASYFNRFSSEELTQSVAELGSSGEIAERRSVLSKERSQDFSWKTHVEEILKLADSLVGSGGSAAGQRKSRSGALGITAVTSK